MAEDILLFVGASLYLSLPQYIPIAPRLKNFRKVFLFLNDPATIRFDKVHLNKDHIKRYFDYFLKLKYII